MPLIANEDGNGTPSKCTTDECRKFQGLSGAGGGASGSDARDTYSVLATFSGQAAGAASSPQASATIAQYFATGIAARLLAQYGGAAVVNSQNTPTQPSAISAAHATKIVNKKTRQVAAILGKLTKTNGDVDSAALGKLLGLTPAQDLPNGVQTRLNGLKTRSELEEDLLDGPEKTVETLFNTIDQL